MNIETAVISDSVALPGTNLFERTSWMDAPGGIQSIQRSSLVIADAGIADADILLNQLEPGIDLWRVESCPDFGALLREALQGGYERLHFLGHGQPGAITIGGKLLDLEDFAVSSTLKSEAAPSMHFWSCLTGYGAKGRAFVDGIAQAFDTAVTAFSGLVGAKERGGSWFADVFSRTGVSAPVPFGNAYAYSYSLVTAEQAVLDGITTNMLTPAMLVTWAASADSQVYTGAVALANNISGLTPMRFAALKFDLVNNWAADGTALYGTMGELWGQLQPLATLRIAAEAAFQAAYSGGFTINEFNAMRNALPALVGKVVNGTSITQANIDQANTLSNAMLTLPLDRLGLLSAHMTSVAIAKPTTMDVWNELVILSNTNSSLPVFTSGTTGSVNEYAATGTVIYSAATTDADLFSPHTFTLSGTGATLIEINATTGVVTLKASANYDANHTYSFGVVAHDGNVVHDTTQSVVVSVVNLPPTTTITGLALSADTGVSSTDFVTNVANQTVTATLSAVLGTDHLFGSVDNGTNWTDITTKVSGTAVTWNGVTLSSYSSIKLEVRDLTGTAGTAASHTYVLDTTAPNTSLSGVVVDLLAPSDTGLSDTDNITSVTTPTVAINMAGKSGLVAGELIQVIDSNHGNAVVGSYSIQGTDLMNAGSWIGTTHDITLSVLSEGSHDLKAQIGDLAGNAAASSATALTVTVDSQASSVSMLDALVDLKTSSDSGISSTDNITSVAAPTVTIDMSTRSGLVAGDIIQVIDSNHGNTVLGSYSIQGADLTSGAWNRTTQDITLSTLSAGAHDLKVRLGDVAGNTTAPGTTPLTVTVGYDLTGAAHYWNGGAVISGATATMSSATDVTDVTDVNGAYNFDTLPPGAYQLGFHKTVDATVTGAITTDDALAALRMSVGFNPNANNAVVTPYQFMAADIDHDGQILPTDALFILKMVVHMTTGVPANEWVFVPETVGSIAMDRHSVASAIDPLPVTLGQNTTMQLVGIVMGDVNGNWHA